MDESKYLEKKIAESEIFNGCLLHVFKDEVLLPNGNKSVREYIKHVGAACVVPLTDENEVIMERQFRYPFGRVILEIPAGKLDSAAEDPEAAALRELEEETGVTASEMIYLGPFFPSCAYSNEVIHIYLARGLSFGKTHLDADEFITVEKIPLASLVSDVMEGRIADGKTQTALLKAYYYINHHSI